MLIANARMYSVNAQAATAWQTLLEWVIERAGVHAEAIDYPPPQPLSSLWARPDLACAFMCGYPYALAAPKPALLAAPVPSPGGYGGKPVYWSDLVVRADAPFVELNDVFGQRLAYTIEDSQSGYQAARELLAPYARERGGQLFTATVGPLITPRRVAEAVIAGEADVGPLDSYAHALIRAHEPELAAQLRTIATTTPTPIPPLVAAPGIATADIEHLRAALLDIADAGELRSIRSALLLDGFAEVEPEDYGVLLERARAADRYDYPRLA
jgi:ABC-type phosphate/phosphonate transport system substrate-binding protein